MPTDHREQLAGIRRFDQLVAFLRDELDWPIGSADFEELTFEYTPEELGIDGRNAAKIQEIKRLRPLAPGQPWGIFFVKFQPKRLPVVALRRILGQVAIRKRASAHAAERQSWAADDLLFVSNYGEGDQRRIAFAHFSEAQVARSLPTLKVLGWDNLDTPLHLDDVARKLTDHLAWPDDEDDAAAWRKQWRAAFRLRHQEVITTSQALSVRLAELARAIRDRAKSALGIESAAGPLTRLMKAFQTALLDDLDADGFADMYAQTIAYGLLSARIADPERKTVDGFATHMRSNPFLRELMEAFFSAGGHPETGTAGIDFDELGVSEVVELLDRAKMEAVLRDFGDRNPREDPVIHFYEHFLTAYDKDQKVKRGVFYTPRPVVSYIVRSVDELLRTEFHLADGLADTTTWGEMARRGEVDAIPDGTSPDDHFVRILDPATGTGTFLVEAIGLIHETMADKWKAQGHDSRRITGLWNDYVPRHLLPRLHGYELLMAPYAIAHLKIGLRLYETGYRFGSDERAHIYLTNALEPPADTSQFTMDFLPALAHEAEAVGRVKRGQQFTVVIGNPPYSGVSANMQPSVRKTIDRYRYVDGCRIKEKGALQFEKNLNEDYVKFVRFAESTIARTMGIVGFVTNNTYLDAVTLRGMRSSLLDTFSTLHIIDLHGDVDKRERADDGRPDSNVFAIKHGVAIAVLCRHSGRATVGVKGDVRLVDVKGDRQEKYEWLLQRSVASGNWTTLQPRHDRYNYCSEDYVLAAEYRSDSSVSVARMFGVSSTGFESGRDKILIGLTKNGLRTRIKWFGESTSEAVRSRFSVEKGWGAVLMQARASILPDPAFDAHFRQLLFSPFDFRWCYLRKDLVKTNSLSAGKHLLEKPNVALIVMRQVSLDAPFTHVGVSRYVVNNRCFYSTKGKASYFPLYLRHDPAGVLPFSPWPKGRHGRRPNLDPGFVERLAQAAALRFVSDGTGDVRDSFGPEDVLAYIYAAFHSPGYRARYEAQLKLDFPRVPLPGSPELFRQLVIGGHHLLGLHLMESPDLDDLITDYAGPRNPDVGRVGWSNGTVWLNAAKTNARQRHRATVSGQYGFHGVPEEVWDFQIGGYQVCHKWLKDRKGRTLSDDDIAHYQKIVVAVSETISIMAAIDDMVEEHGGWPGAFHAATESAGKPAGLAVAAESRPAYEVDRPTGDSDR